MAGTGVLSFQAGLRPLCHRAHSGSRSQRQPAGQHQSVQAQQYTGSIAHQDAAERPHNPSTASYSPSDPLGDPPQAFLEALEGLSQRIGAREEADEDLAGFMPGRSNGSRPQVTGDTLADGVQRTKRKGRRGGAELVHQIPAEALPKVAIVGRPNVGKSALFNRITESGASIVYDYPGVTRDCIYSRAEWGTSEFLMIDTGGLMNTSEKLPASLNPVDIRGLQDSGLPEAIEAQAARGIEEADVLVLVMDGQAGFTPADQDIVSWLRKNHARKPWLLCINKCENAAKADMQAAEFWSIGPTPFPVSAISGSGTGDMMDALRDLLPPPVPQPPPPTTPEDAPLRVAIIGRPNVGKSSLVNALTGEKKAIVSPISGTTRDAVDTQLIGSDGTKFTLVDTAGIRRRTAVKDSPDGAEPLSVSRAIKAMRRSDVVVLVIDGADCAKGPQCNVPVQDFRLAEMVAAEGRACVICVNKWDAIPDRGGDTMGVYEKDVLAQLHPISWATLVFTSAAKGQRVSSVLKAAQLAGQQHRKRVTTATLNIVVRDAVAMRPPPSQRSSSRRGRLYYATQAAIQPPTFVMFVNDTKLIDDQYKTYLARQLRDNIDLTGTPIRLLFRGKPPSSDRRQPPGGNAD